MRTKPLVTVRNLGRIAYNEAWKMQQALLDEIVQIKKRNRVNTLQVVSPHYFLFCEHNPVYTLGKSGKEKHLLLDFDQLDKEDIEFYKINRGGDITFHGPGQIVGYPIFDLDYFFTDVHRYVRSIEEAIIRTLKDYDVVGSRVEGYTGVWLPAKNGLPAKKICAIGVHLSRWVTMHGFALNVNTELTYFNHIVPCGINDSDKAVTSLAKELGKQLNMVEVKKRILTHFADVFEFRFAYD